MTLVGRAYDRLREKRLALLCGLLAFLAACIILFLRAPIRADVQAMLPAGDDNRLIEDLSMLSGSGLANSLFITVRADNDMARAKLGPTADRLVEQLTSPEIAFVTASSVNPVQVMTFLLDNAPNLMSETDLRAIAPNLTPGGMRERLTEAKRLLLSPQSPFLKPIIRRDPLDFRTRLAPRLKRLAGFSQARIADGHIVDATGNAILLTAHTIVPLTDADGAARLLSAFAEATESLPSGISADLVAGHVHTNANATTIQKDLLVISLAALFALGALFAIFFRSRTGVAVFLAPGVAMAAALGALGISGDTISAIVIGFGAVLIGISIDFAMHIYFAISSNPASPGKTTGTMAKPLVYCTLTSCAAFGALFLSTIPGIRQLALFSMAGLIASLLFSLFILPHWCRGRWLPRPSRQARANSILWPHGSSPEPSSPSRAGSPCPPPWTRTCAASVTCRTVCGPLKHASTPPGETSATRAFFSRIVVIRSRPSRSWNIPGNPWPPSTRTYQ